MTESPHILIADSGATKTDWCLAQNGTPLHRFCTKGISPIYQSEEEISAEIAENVSPQLQGKTIDAIRFYGSGNIPEKIPAVKRAIANVFTVKDIEVFSDLVAAAHALCGHRAGIACILGTGSNSCEWDGEKILAQISPLGFILGDEGSGGTLGKLLVGNALKNQLTPGLKEKFLSQFKLTTAEIINRVYRQPFPSRFLASLSPFLLENIGDKSICRIVEESFSDFFERNVKQYDYRNNKVHLVGSIAWHYQAVLKSVAEKKGVAIGKIEQSPMAELIKYHRQ
ncbi:MAG: ATPase [Dysgonamonadaceae bacterium]|jgi:N-acetylglucosamine kinase-like BadF-type ATPase|nr:ATPase [Dysgonamonadaceae bacterium]